MPRISVCIAGATGLVGQTLLARLSHHPWFDVGELLADNHRDCLTYREAVRNRFAVPEAARYADRKLRPLDAPVDCPLIFSCLPSGIAGTWETFWARRGHQVITNAADHRLDPMVPLIIPEINAHHLTDEPASGGSGQIIANPNCGVAGFALVTGALVRHHLLNAAVVTTLQSISGAGLKGLSAFDITNNLLPFIPEEEDKWEHEPAKILGDRTPGGFQPYPLRVEATCIRVPTRRGHLIAVTLIGDPELTPDSAREILHQFKAPPEIHELPSCPSQPIRVLNSPDRPQPIFDLDPDGMTVTVGRLRGQPGRIRWVALVDNLQRGAAGNAVLNAELVLCSRQ